MSEIPRITSRVEESTVVQKVRSFLEAQIVNESGFNDKIKEEIKAVGFSSVCIQSCIWN